MNVVVAIDSFKGSLTSLQAGNAVKEAVLELDKTAQVAVRPLADGGEGTVEAISAGLGGELITVTVTGPLGAPVAAQYCLLKEKKTAVIEMSAAAGITLVSPEQRNPLETTTYGVGELIKDAVKRGCRHFIIGIGGSATNDGGIGMLSALGFGFLDKEGKPVALGGKGLQSLAEITVCDALPELAECTFRIACDVNNPLCGPRGCSAIYGPQKGGTPEILAAMDSWLENYGRLACAHYPEANMDFPGAGAAGGLGFAFMSFLGGQLQSGIEIILEETKLEDYIKNADIVVTGEGRLDAQTVMGKAPVGVAALAKKYGKQVIAFSGCVTEDAVACNAHGIDAYFPIVPGAVSLEDAMNPENAYRNLVNTARQVFRLIFLGK